jgi:hypothetical protein
LMLGLQWDIDLELLLGLQRNFQWEIDLGLGLQWEIDSGLMLGLQWDFQWDIDSALTL